MQYLGLEAILIRAIGGYDPALLLAYLFVCGLVELLV